MTDWIDPDAPPNGLGPTCRHCHRLIDSHPWDHAPRCPEYRHEALRPMRPIPPRWDTPTEPELIIVRKDEWQALKVEIAKLRNGKMEVSTTEEVGYDAGEDPETGTR